MPDCPICGRPMDPREADRNFWFTCRRCAINSPHRTTYNSAEVSEAAWASDLKRNALKERYQING